MNIQIKDYVGLSENEILKLVSSLIDKRKPDEGLFDYGLESHGAIWTNTSGAKIPYPITVHQSNKRRSKKSPIIIEIKRHYPII